MKLYKLLRRGKQIVTLLPGQYAGNKKTKIFGRLDCESGKLTSKEDRVFFSTWKNAIRSGYRSCEKCKPNQMDKYPEQEIIKDALLAKPHIALWESEEFLDYFPYEPTPIWHVHLNWQDKHALKGHYRQIVLSEDLPYKTARDIALEVARRCNIPVLKHGHKKFRVISVPEKRTNDLDKARDKKVLGELMKINKDTTSSKGKQ
jgi:hypothetical protein